MINWKVRIRNRAFWAALIPAVLLLAQSVAAAFGVELALTEVGSRLLGIINQLFAVLTILGIVNDPTTAGLGDSDQALGYAVPRKSA